MFHAYLTKTGPAMETLSNSIFFNICSISVPTAAQCEFWWQNYRLKTMFWN